jgi:hypothetical protein
MSRGISINEFHFQGTCTHTDTPSSSNLSEEESGSSGWKKVRIRGGVSVPGIFIFQGIGLHSFKMVVREGSWRRWLWVKKKAWNGAQIWEKSPSAIVCCLPYQLLDPFPAYFSP